MKKQYFLILFTFYSLLLNSQVFFGPPNLITSDAIAYPEAVFSADLDGDGDMDILTGSQGDNTVAWFENLDGMGNFGAVNKLVVDVRDPRTVISFDVDGDNDQDIVYGDWNDYHIIWMENLDGMGNFGLKKTIDNYAAGIWKLHPADADNDGDLDLFAALREGGAIVWYENLDGKGSFSEKNYIFNDMKNARDAYPVDLDGDGDVDVATSDWFTNEIAWHENIDGQGTYSVRKIIYDQAKYVDRLICMDYNGDGYNDILALDYDKLIWFQNLNGSGNFSNPNLISNEPVIDFFATDFDGDGDLDIQASINYDGTLAWYKNDGQGVFSPVILIPNGLEGSDQVIATDLNGDGYKDMVGISWTKSHILWHENTDGMGTTGPPQYIAQPDLSSPVELILNDMDNDGDREILVASNYDDKVYLYDNNYRSGEYGMVQLIAENIDQPSSLFAADLDGDAKRDVLMTSFSSENIYWVKNIGNNQFGNPQILGTSSYSVSDVIASDLDNDGDQDVLVTSIYGNTVSWLENMGAGIFAQETIISNQVGGATDVFTADVNGDGFPDVLCASQYDDKISLFKNMGINNPMGPEIILDNDMNGTRKVIAADMDGDGDLDVIACAYDKINWYENLDGNGTYSSFQRVSGEWDQLQWVSDITVSDVDNDGDLDVFSALEDKGKLVWYMNENGTNEFIRDENRDITGLNEPIGLRTEDVDMDGRLDIISASFKDNKIQWYRNELFPVFITQPSDQSFCESGTALFTVATDKADAYQWQIANPYTDWFNDMEDVNGFTGTSTSQLTYNFMDPGLNQAKFRCIVSYLGGKFTSDHALLTIDPLIVANAGEDQEICGNMTYLYGNWPGNGDGLWTVDSGNAQFDDPSQDYCLATNIQSGVNVLKWTITNGECVSEDLVEITRFDSVDLSVPFNTLLLNEGDDAVLSVNVTGDAVSYQWYKGSQLLMDDERINGAQSADLTIKALQYETDQGNYYCIVTGKCNIEYSPNIFLEVTIVNTENLGQSILRIFPNPARESITVSANERLQNVRIFDIQGQQVLEVLPGVNQYTISFPEIISGTYFIQVQTDKMVWINKLILDE